MWYSLACPTLPSYRTNSDNNLYAILVDCSTWHCGAEMLLMKAFCMHFRLLSNQIESDHKSVCMCVGSVQFDTDAGHNTIIPLLGLLQISHSGFRPHWVGPKRAYTCVGVFNVMNCLYTASSAHSSLLYVSHTALDLYWVWPEPVCISTRNVCCDTQALLRNLIQLFPLGSYFFRKCFAHAGRQQWLTCFGVCAEWYRSFLPQTYMDSQQGTGSVKSVRCTAGCITKQLMYTSSCGFSLTTFHPAIAQSHSPSQPCSIGSSSFFHVLDILLALSVVKITCSSNSCTASSAASCSCRHAVTNLPRLTTWNAIFAVLKVFLRRLMHLLVLAPCFDAHEQWYDAQTVHGF